MVHYEPTRSWTRKVHHTLGRDRRRSYGSAGDPAGRLLPPGPNQSTRKETSKASPGFGDQVRGRQLGDAARGSVALPGRTPVGTIRSKILSRKTSQELGGPGHGLLPPPGVFLGGRRPEAANGEGKLMRPRWFGRWRNRAGAGDLEHCLLNPKGTHRWPSPSRPPGEALKFTPEPGTPTVEARGMDGPGGGFLTWRAGRGSSPGLRIGRVRASWASPGRAPVRSAELAGPGVPGRDPPPLHRPPEKRGPLRSTAQSTATTGRGPAQSGGVSVGLRLDARRLPPSGKLATHWQHSTRKRVLLAARGLKSG